MQIVKGIKRAALSTFLGCAMVASAQAAELLVVEQHNCPYCEKFHAEIAPAYPKTAEGKLAPLRLVQLEDSIAPIKAASVTPTFILVNNGVEIDRLVGYPGDEYFWFLLGEMLQKLGP